MTWPPLLDLARLWTPTPPILTPPLQLPSLSCREANWSRFTRPSAFPPCFHRWNAILCRRQSTLHISPLPRPRPATPREDSFDLHLDCLELEGRISSRRMSHMSHMTSWNWSSRKKSDYEFDSKHEVLSLAAALAAFFHLSTDRK